MLKDNFLLFSIIFLINLNLLYATNDIEKNYTETLISNDSNFYNSNSGDNTRERGLNLNWPVVLLFIFPVFGTIGNYLVCCAIIRDQSLQTHTNFYLFSLAISDLAVSLIVAPLAIINNFLGKTWY